MTDDDVTPIEIPAVRPKVVTTDGRDPDVVRDEQVGQPTGQHRSYLVLSPEERAKGFVRAVRTSYKHVGPPGPRFPLRDLTDDEKARHAAAYVKFEPYPESMRPVTGSFWTQARLDAVDKGCGQVTTMGRAIAETYARTPTFYGATFCCSCNRHIPVGEHGEFVWVDGGRETTERVGT